MNTFYSEYPFGDFLGDSKFDELSKFLLSHFQKKNAVNNMVRVTFPCLISYFDVSGRQRVFILYLVIFSLPYLMTWNVERLLPTGSSSNQMIFMRAPLQALTIYKYNLIWLVCLLIFCLST